MPHGAGRRARPRRSRGARPARCRATGAPPASAPAPSSRSCGPYEPGDDVRQIDAAATARTGVPHVRLHVPERTLTTWIVLDVSPSMAFGTAAAAEGRRRRGRGACVRAPGRAPRRAAWRWSPSAPGARGSLPPRGSTPGVVALRRRSPRASRRTARPEPHALADALGRRAAVARQPGLVARDLRLPRPGGLDAAARRAARPPLRARRSRSAIRARRELPAVGRLALVDPETGERIEVDTSRRARARALRRARARAPRAAVARELRRLRRPPRRAVHRSATGCASSGGGCDELRHPALAARAGAGPAGARAGRLQSRRRAQRYAVRFTGVRDAQRSPPPAAAWRRHLPAALALAALAALVLALAKPQQTVAVPVDRASIMLVTDHSGSMAADRRRARAAWRRRSARRTPSSTSCPSQVRVGVVAFSDAPDAVAGAERPTTRRRAPHRSTARSPTARPPPATRSRSPSTRCSATARQKASARRRRSCCSPTARPRLGRDPVPVARAAGTAEDPDLHRRARHRDATVPNPARSGTPLLGAARPATLRQIAQVSGGKAFTAEDSDPLKSIYKTLGSQLGTKTEAADHGDLRHRRARPAPRRRVLLAALARAPALVGRRTGALKLARGQSSNLAMRLRLPSPAFAPRGAHAASHHAALEARRPAIFIAVLLVALTMVSLANLAKVSDGGRPTSRT